MFARFFGAGTPEAADGASAREEEGGGSNAPSETPQKDPAVASHISKMDSIIRRKLHGTGAQYNMKVVIRGERGVGKSTLWRRLQGLPYEDKYTPTPEIQTTTINNWVYRGSQDVVKVEVWDVVDKGLSRGGVGRVPEGVDLEDAVAGLPDSGPGAGGRSLAVLDAGVVNVYQGANAIIFMVDPYRPETLDKVERGLAEAPVNLPTVVLLNFRDKLEEDAVAKASEKDGTRRAPQPPPKTTATTTTEAPDVAAAGSPPDGDGNGREEASASGAAGADGGAPDHPGTEQAAAGREDGDSSVRGGGTGGAWDHVVTLETARLMMERVREADEAAGRGSGRRVSLFDCSMKNCFGLRVLYTYLNVPFLELKRQSLLQQARIAAERLEKEYQELAGFIEGHSYRNYMQHLRTSDVDPTAGRSAPAAPPGRPSIASMPATGEAYSLERRGSADSAGGGGGGGKKDRKKKHHKDKDKGKDKERSKKKDKHRHKGGKSRKDERDGAAPEYGGRVTDAKDFAPVAKKAATDELADFFGESSEGGSDDGLQERRKVVKAIDRSALASVNAARADATDSDEMPTRRTSRLKRVTAPAKPVASAATNIEKPSSTVKSPRPAGGGPGVVTAAGAAGAGPTAKEQQRPPPQSAEPLTAPNKVGEADEAEKDEEQPGVRGNDEGSPEEPREMNNAGAPGEGEGSKGKRGGKAAAMAVATAAGAEATTIAEREESAVASGGEDGVDGDDLSGTGVAAAGSSSTPARSHAGKEAVAAVHDGRKPAREVVLGGARDALVADRESDGRRDQAVEENLAGGQDRETGTLRDSEVRGDEAEAAGEQGIVSAKASGSPAKQSSPAAQQHLPSESHALPQQPEDAGAEAVPGDVGDDGAAVGESAETGADDQSAQQEDDVHPRANTGPAHASVTGVEEEGGAAPEAADELPGTDGVDGGGQGEHATAMEEDTPIVSGSQQAETDNVAPASEAVEADKNGGLGAGAKEETGSGEEGIGGADGGGTGSGSKAQAEAEAEAETEVDGASAAGEVMRGDGVEKPGAAAAAAVFEPEAFSGGDDGGGGEVMSGGLAEEFFAGDNSSGEDELYTGAAGAFADRFSGNGQYRPDPAAGEQPPSPRIIASSVQGGFRSPAESRRSETAAAKGEDGLSEAAKAAVAAALANAASATSRRGDDGDGGSKSRKKKKKSHKERRRKRSGSNSAGEEDSGVRSRGSGSVGRSEVDGGGRTKRSSSRRHHRESAEG
eukprot:g6477.t1